MKYRIYFILSMMIFGTIGLIVKLIPMKTNEISLISCGIGFIFLLIIFIMQNNKLSPWKIIKKNLLFIFLSSFCLSCNWIFLYGSYQYTTITNATLAYYFSPIIVTLMSVSFLNEELSKKKIICILFSLIGLVMILQSGLKTDIDSNDFKGLLLGLIAALFYAGLMIIGKFIKKMNKLELTLIQIGLSFVILLTYKIYESGLNMVYIDKTILKYLLILGVVNTGIGFLLFFSGIEKISGQSAAMLSYVDPLVAIFLSNIIFNESMTIFQFIGGGFILASTFISEVEIRFLNDHRKRE